MTARPARSRPPRTPRLTAAAVAGAGMVNLISVAVPVERARLHLLATYVPGVLVTTATAATAASGVGLLLLAGGLRRRRRSALLATVVLLLVGAVLHLLKGLDLEVALVEAFLGGLLLGKADRFGAHASPNERRPVLRPAMAVMLLTLGVGVLGLLANRHNVDGALIASSALWEVASLAVGLPGPLELDGRFGRFFPITILVMFVVGAALVVLRLLAPALSRRRPDPGLPDLVARSEDSLAYFALRDDRSSVRAGGAVVSYGTAGTVALAAGDPLGPPPQWPGAVGAFLAEAAGQGRVAAVIGCGAAAARVYQQAGLLAVDLDPDTVTALRALSRRWLGGAAERGFSMALGRLFDPHDQHTYVVAAQDRSGQLRGFLHFVPWGSDGASLDVMRRDRQAPAILNDYLVVEAAMRLRELGVRRISLNFSFLRGVLAAGAEPTAPLGLRLQRWALRRLSRRFQIETLYRFNKKFDPAWLPRYLAVEAIEDLPRVALGALRLEGLLAPSRPPARQRGDQEQPTPDGSDLPTHTS